MAGRGGGRPHGLPSGPAVGLPGGPASGMRPQQRPSPGPPSSLPPGPGALPPSSISRSATPLNKAEQFKDEQRRIIASCFGSRGADGRPSESYITHVRVIEDGRSPQTPPPPSANPDSKKDRMVILAVKDSGRVRLHKARENSNGSFSIGKTWNFEELTEIESYSDYKPRGPQDAQFGKWAGDTGFTVTVGKPYFWQTRTQMEKMYFVASIVKVYNRYTKGNMPKLTGFLSSELDEINRTVDGAKGANNMSTPGPSQPIDSARTQSPYNGRAPFRPPIPPPDRESQSSPRPRTPGQGPPPPLSARRAAFTQDETAIPPALRSKTPDALRPGGPMRQPQSREQLRPTASNTPPPLPSTSSLKSSPSDFAPNRIGTPDSLMAGGPRRAGTFGTPSEPPGSRDGSFNGLGILNNGERRPSDDRLAQNGANGQGPFVPERKRPPMGSPRQFDTGPPIPPLAPGRNMDGPNERSIERAKSPEPPSSFVPPRSPERVRPRGLSINKKPSEPISPPQAPLEPELAPTPAPADPEPEATPVSPPAEREEPGSARPALGRMFGGQKKSTKELIKNAAAAYGAFKPRAGGAAAKLFADPNKSNEPDGITGVVPAPKLARSMTSDSIDTPISATSAGSIQRTPIEVEGKKSLPNLKITKAGSVTPVDMKSPEIQNKKLPKSPAGASPQVAALQAKAAELQQKSKADEDEVARRKLRRTPNQMKYLDRLGVDPAIFEGRGLEYEALLEEFWPHDVWHTKPVDTLQAEIRRELSRVQTGSWFEHISSQDEERKAAIKLIDIAAEETEVLEKLLTIYSVELGSLSDDIAYIEAQGQGLQVQTSNQKLLQSELKGLLETVDVPPQQLDAIFNANVINIDGLESTERAVLTLYKALLLTDPSIRPGTDSSEQASDLSSLSKMRALQEKRNDYLEASKAFLSRFQNYMDIVYGQAVMEVENNAKKDTTKSASNSSLNVVNVKAGQTLLWKYSPLILYAKSLDRPSWRDLIRSYQAKMRQLYGDSLKSTIGSCKKLARNTQATDEQEILFTNIEHNTEGSLSASARRLTVKRSGTLARTFRVTSGDKGATKVAALDSGTMLPCEAFGVALNEVTPLLLTEQTFIVDFFHAHTTGGLDFAEAVQATLPESRRGPVDLNRKEYEPDQEMVHLITGVMSDIFAFLPAELQSMVSWAINAGSLQGVGVLYFLNKVMTTIDDGFFYRTLHVLATQLTNDWSRFLNAQVRAIEETKVKIKKRKGVIPFMKVFPLFAASIENTLPASSDDISDARKLVNQGYAQIIKAMFEALRVIAKESPSSAPHTGSSDPEDKEALNYHILLIENMNHYVEHVDERNNTALKEGKAKAKEDLDEHLSLYIDAVIRRPLGKIMDYTESLSSALDALPDSSSAPTLASKPAFALTAYRKLIASHEPRELRRGVDALRKRVDKHFGGDEADGDRESGRALVLKVLERAEDKYVRELEKVQGLPKAVYGDDFSALQAPREEINRWFKGGK